MKINLIVHPKAYGGNTEFHSCNSKQKAWIKLGNTNGHFWMQFVNAQGLADNLIFSHSGVSTESVWPIPQYAHKLIRAANRHLNSLIGYDQ